MARLLRRTADRLDPYIVSYDIKSGIVQIEGKQVKIPLARVTAADITDTR